MEYLAKALKEAKEKREFLTERLIREAGSSAEYQIRKELEDLDEDIEEIINLRDRHRNQAESYGLDVEEGKSELEELLAEHDDSTLEIGLIHYLNCDRTFALDTFWQVFQNNREQALQYQVYFITACQTQRPDRFSERLLFEVINYEELEEDEDAAIFYRYNDEDRLDTFDLPLLPDLESSKLAFRKHFSKEFELSGAEEINTFLTGKAVGYEYKTIFLAYEMDGNNWRDFIPEYYRWIVDNFKAINRKGANFFLSFVHIVPDAHDADRIDPRDAKVIAALDRLALEDEIACHISGLPEVPLRDLRSWLRMIRIKDVYLQDDLIEYALKQLKSREKAKYEEKELLDMQPIDLLQKEILDNLLRQNK